MRHRPLQVETGPKPAARGSIDDSCTARVGGVISRCSHAFLYEEAQWPGEAERQGRWRTVETQRVSSVEKYQQHRRNDS